MRRVQRWWWRRVGAIVAPSRFLKGIVEGYGIDPGKVRLIYNSYHGPTSFPEDRETARRALDLPANERVVLTVCRLVSWKGVDGLLQVMRRLGEGHRLVVCGDGPEQESLQEMARDLGVEDRVRFAGNVPHESVARHVRAADVFVLNSNYEGLSHTLLEVMHLGCPIVASDAGGNPELIEDGVNGRVVGYNRIGELERAVRDLLDDREAARRYVEASREKARGFQRDDHLRHVEALFEEIVGRRASSIERPVRSTEPERVP